jgi:hypothetical protein
MRGEVNTNFRVGQSLTGKLESAETISYGGLFINCKNMRCKLPGAGKQAPGEEMGLAKHHDGDQDTEDQDCDRQQIYVVPQPRFFHGYCVSKEGRHKFLSHRRLGRR